VPIGFLRLRLKVPDRRIPSPVRCLVSTAGQKRAKRVLSYVRLLGVFENRVQRRDPLPNAIQWPALSSVDGLWTPAIIRGVIQPSRLIVDIEPGRVGCEITLHLAGFDPNYRATQRVRVDASIKHRLTDAARAAVDQIDALIRSRPDRPGHRHRIFLPRPAFVHGWTHTIHPASAHGGYLFLAGDDRSLNERIASAGLCPVFPVGIN